MPAQWLNGDDRINGWLRIVGRLHPDATVAQAQHEMDRIAEHIKTISPDNAHVDFRLHVASVLDDLVKSSRPLLVILMGAVTFVLLIA